MLGAAYCGEQGDETIKFYVNDLSQVLRLLRLREIRRNNLFGIFLKTLEQGGIFLAYYQDKAHFIFACRESREIGVEFLPFFSKSLIGVIKFTWSIRPVLITSFAPTMWETT